MTTPPPINRTDFYLHAMPARPLAESKVWRFTVQWREVVHWARFEADDLDSRCTFIRDFAVKAGIPFEHLFWLDSAMDEALKATLAGMEELETLDRRITLAHSRLDSLERQALETERAVSKAFAEWETLTKRVDRIAEFCTELKRERNGKHVQRETETRDSRASATDLAGDGTPGTAGGRDPVPPAC
jgi:hypothetical protein